MWLTPRGQLPNVKRIILLDQESTAIATRCAICRNPTVNVGILGLVQSGRESTILGVLEFSQWTYVKGRLSLEENVKTRNEYRACATDLALSHSQVDNI